MRSAQPRSAWRRVVAITFWLALIAEAAIMGPALTTPGWLLLIVGIPLAWALADLTTGLAHWALDTYGTPQTPVVGPFIHEFRHHHEAPRAICDSDAIETCSSAALAGWPLLVLAHLGVARHWLSPAAGTLLLVYLAGGVLTNYFHLLAHAEAPPDWAKWMQRRGIILSPAEHDRHHRGDHRLAYCITVGWLNCPLERLRFFERLERVFPPRDLPGSASATPVAPGETPVALRPGRARPRARARQ